MENKNPKTISYLKSKIWYRLLKVFFILGLLFALIIFNTIAFSAGVQQIDPNLTLVQCNSIINRDNTNTSQKVFSLGSIGLNLSAKYFPNGQFDYKEYFEDNNDYPIRAILTVCSPKTIERFGTNATPRLADIYDFQKAEEIKYTYDPTGSDNLSQDQINSMNSAYSAYQQETQGMFGNEKTQFLDFSYQMFHISPVFTYKNFLELFFIGNAIILFIFEAVRRFFYYVVLGSIKPQKGQ